MRNLKVLIQSYAMQKRAKNTGVNSSQYDEKYYSNVNEGWKEFAQGKVSKRLIKAVELSGKDFKGRNVLDIGCGRGELCSHLAKLGAKCVGIDYSAAAVKIAKKAFKGKGIDFLRMDCTKLAFPDESFDAVFMMDIVEHLTPKQLGLAVEEARRIIQPGGQLIIHTMPNAFLAKPFYLLCKVTGTKRGVNETVHINEQTTFSLKQLLKNFDTKIFLAHDKDYFKNTVFYSKFRTKARPLLELLFQHDFSKTPILKVFIASEIFVVARKPSFTEGKS